MNEYLKYEKEPIPESVNGNGKFLAIVAGSYAAYLGKVVKRYDDIDVFVLVTNPTISHLAPLWNLVTSDGPDWVHWLNNNNVDAHCTHIYKDILWVRNFGKIQLTGRYYPR